MSNWKKLFSCRKIYKWNGIRNKNKWLDADVVMWAQMWSVRLSLTLAEKLWIEESVYTEKWGEDDTEMILKRHNIDLTGKKVVLSEDIVTKWSN